VQLFAVSSNNDIDLLLVGVVCYYGKHNSTFFFHSKRKTWISFDDSCVSEVILNFIGIDVFNTFVDSAIYYVVLTIYGIDNFILW